MEASGLADFGDRFWPVGAVIWRVLRACAMKPVNIECTTRAARMHACTFVCTLALDSDTEKCSTVHTRLL
jgi:hypothetical protein